MSATAAMRPHGVPAHPRSQQKRQERESSRVGDSSRPVVAYALPILVHPVESEISHEWCSTRMRMKGVLSDCVAAGLSTDVCAVSFFSPC